MFHKLTEAYKCLKSMSNIQRFALHPCIKPQSVSEHSYRVAMLALIIAMQYRDKRLNSDRLPRLDISEVLIKALLHDCEESINGDIPYDTKRANKKFFDKLERCTIKNDLFNENEELKKFCLNNKKGLTGFVVELADMLEMAMYAREEIALGNEKNMEDLFYKCIGIIKKTISESKYDGFDFLLEAVHSFEGTVRGTTDNR